MKTKYSPQSIAIAACLVELNSAAPAEIQLFPAGEFNARDGRPAGLSGWQMNAVIAKQLIAQANSQQDYYVIDYEHQTLNSKTNGHPAPASGWFKQLEWREGVGLFAVNVDWTVSAATAIESKAYRYISPVFSYHPQTGMVTALLMAALVNTPALDGMLDLAALAADFFTQQDIPMELDELLERLRYLFNLPTLATIDEIKVELDKAKALLSDNTTTAAGLSFIDLLANKNNEIAALKANTPDPASYAPVAAMAELHGELAALKAEMHTEKLTQMVTAALSDGRLLPPQKDWAMSLSMDALNGYLKTTQPIAALSALQTGGKAPADSDKSSLNADELAVCSAMGLTHEEFIANKGGL